MKRKSMLITVVTLVAILLTATVAFAAWNINTDGTGFVGKGDVQQVYSWSNKDLQNNAGSVRFRANSEVVTEVSWICTNSKNEETQERARTTTTSV
jgi:hypothetical protein